MMESRCLICGAPTFEKGRDAPAYCPKHRAYAKADRIILRNIDLDATFRICYAILQRAKDDYVFNSDNQRSDAEVFFKSNWAQIITNGELDPDAVIKELDRRIEINGLNEAGKDIE